MLTDKIREAYSAKLEADNNAMIWKGESRERMKSVRMLIAAEKRFTPGFDGDAFIATLDKEYAETVAASEKMESEQTPGPDSTPDLLAE